MPSSPVRRCRRDATVADTTTATITPTRRHPAVALLSRQLPFAHGSAGWLTFILVRAYL